MKHTANGIPYPEANDMQGDYPPVAKAVAEKLDAAASRIQAGIVSRPTNSGVADEHVVQFPRAFNTIPAVTVSVDSRQVGAIARLRGSTATNFTVLVERSSGAATILDYKLHWIAVTP